VAEAAGLREAVYVDEHVFRSDEDGVAQAVEGDRRRSSGTRTNCPRLARREEAGEELAVRREQVVEAAGP
jgi:hypothetical protein